MSTKHRIEQGVRLPDPDFVHPEVVAPETRAGKAFRYVAAALRLSLGWVFFWAFLDKTFGLGFATPPERAWIEGGSPTTGFLKGVEGTFADFFNGMAGQAWADWLFMIGSGGDRPRPHPRCGDADRGRCGLADAGPHVGRGASAPEQPVHGRPPHLLDGPRGPALVSAGRTVGFGAAWERLHLVQRNGWLK